MNPTPEDLAIIQQVETLHRYINVALHTIDTSKRYIGLSQSSPILVAALIQAQVEVSNTKAITDAIYALKEAVEAIRIK